MTEELTTTNETYSPWGRWLGVGLFLVLWFCPAPAGLPPAAQRLAAVASLMAIWWVSNAWPVAVTSLLPLVLFPLLGIQSSKLVAGAYFSDSSCLYLGGFMMALGIERWGLHRRLALITICILGSSPKRIVLGFLLSTFTLSMWMSNTATTLVMLPIALSLLQTLGESAGNSTNAAPKGHDLTALSTAMLLGIAYAASIGGVTTLVGTPTNIVFGDLFLKSFPDAPRISAGEWMLVWVPFGLIFLLFCWGLLTWRLTVPPGTPTLEKSFFRDCLQQLGPMQPAERVMAALFLITALLWMLRFDFQVNSSFRIHGWNDWIKAGLKAWNVSENPSALDDWISDSTVAMTAALLMFVVHVPQAGAGWQPLMDWRTASRLPWEILLLFGGGFALADAFRTTGLAVWTGDVFARYSADQPAWLLVTAVCLILVFMTEFTTNVATVNAVLPILATAAVGLGVDPRLLMIPATISASCGFMLPIGTPPNAIVFGTGRVTAAQMARYGLVMNLVGVVLTVLATLFLLAPQQGISARKGLPAWAVPKSPTEPARNP